jgi:oligoendopeptidase F
MSKNWIAKATENKGVKQGEKIPAKKLERATHSDDPKVRKQAALAETLKKLNRRHGGLV